MWLDGIYMLDVFYARWTYEFEPGNDTAWDDIALQFDLIDAGTTVDRERTNGLPLHGFDVSKTQVWADPVTGAAPHVWGRAVGWYIMALVDTLDYFPEKHPGRARLLKYLSSLADAVVAAQDRTYKGWYNIMDPGMETRSGNYIESSGSAMFVYALFKSLRLGYISGRAYEAAALSGYGLMTGTFAKANPFDGSLAWEWTAQTGSLSSNGTFEVIISLFHLSTVTLQECVLTIFFFAKSITPAFRCLRTTLREWRPSCFPRTNMNFIWRPMSEGREKALLWSMYVAGRGNLLARLLLVEVHELILSMSMLKVDLVVATSTGKYHISTVI